MNKKVISLATLGLVACITVIATRLYTSEQKNLPKFTHIEKITLPIANESLASLAIIAYQNNIFKDHGVEVTIKKYKGGKQALLHGLLAGDADLATTADIPIVFNSFTNKNIKIIATIGTSDNEPKIVARKDKKITKPSAY